MYQDRYPAHETRQQIVYQLTGHDPKTVPHRGMALFHQSTSARVQGGMDRGVV